VRTAALSVSRALQQHTSRLVPADPTGDRGHSR
jgi:hypothetical protein